MVDFRDQSRLWNARLLVCRSTAMATYAAGTWHCRPRFVISGQVSTNLQYILCCRQQFGVYSQGVVRFGVAAGRMKVSDRNCVLWCVVVDVLCCVCLYVFEFGEGRCRKPV